MREYEKDLSEVLTRGLRPDRITKEPFLTECYNCYPDVVGIKGVVPPTNLITNCPSIDWPYPVVWLGQDETYLATSSQLYKIESDWSLTSLCGSANYLRDFADFGDYAVFSGNNQVIVKDTDAGTYEAVTADSSFPKFRTCCNFNGQLVVGRIESVWNGQGASSVGWSKIGQADFTVGEGNVAGYRQVHWPGVVYKVRKLGNTVMVYGDNGVGMLAPKDHYFGYRPFLQIGMAGERAWTGNENVHFFVDTSRFLWKVEEGKLPQRLGYQEFFENMTASDIVGTYDERYGHFYFSDGNYTYGYCDNGLFQVGFKLTSCYAEGIYNIGILEVYDDPSGYGADDIVVAVDNLAPVSRGLRTLTFLELGTSVESDVYLGAGYDYGDGKGLQNTSWVRANDQGVGRVQITARDVRPRFRIKEYSTGDVAMSLLAHIQFSDSRFRRGLSYAHTTVA